MHSVSDQTDRRTFTEEARRRHIVDAAIEVIARDGLGRASFARIAERARISPSLISYHFGSRSALLAAVAQTIDADLEASVAGAIGRSTSPRVILRRLIEGFVGFVAGHPTRMLALRNVAAGTGPDEREGVAALDRTRGIQRLEALLREGQRSGELRRFDPTVMASLVMGVLETVPSLVYGDGSISARRVAAELAGAVDRAVATEAGDESGQARRA